MLQNKSSEYTQCIKGLPFGNRGLRWKRNVFQLRLKPACVNFATSQKRSTLYGRILLHKIIAQLVWGVCNRLEDQGSQLHDTTLFSTILQEKTLTSFPSGHNVYHDAYTVEPIYKGHLFSSCGNTLPYYLTSESRTPPYNGQFLWPQWSPLLRGSSVVQ